MLAGEERSVATIFLAESDEDVGEARELFVEYARSLNFSLCFQGFLVNFAELVIQKRITEPLFNIYEGFLDEFLAPCAVACRCSRKSLCWPRVGAPAASGAKRSKTVRKRATHKGGNR